jgi:hypothetical protein
MISVPNILFSVQILTVRNKEPEGDKINILQMNHNHDPLPTPFSFVDVLES